MGDTYEDYPEDFNESLDAVGVLKIATACKEYGTTAFKASNYALALEKYQKGLRYLNEEPDLDNAPEGTKAKLDAIRFVINSNAALANIKLEAWDDAVTNATSAVGISGIAAKDLAKAYYRRGLAQVRLKDEEAAIKDLEEANKLHPDDSAVVNELNTVKTRAANRAAKEKAAYKKFFS